MSAINIYSERIPVSLKQLSILSQVTPWWRFSHVCCRVYLSNISNDLYPDLVSYQWFWFPQCSFGLHMEAPCIGSPWWSWCRQHFVFCDFRVFWLLMAEHLQLRHDAGRMEEHCKDMDLLFIIEVSIILNYCVLHFRLRTVNLQEKVCQDCFSFKG